MSHSRIRFAPAAVLLFFATFSAALEVSPGSSCASKCLDDPKTGNATDRADSSTLHSDLACFDWEYVGANSTQDGKKFRDCQNCLKGSGYSETTWNESDTTWFLFNNRAAVDWCIFGRFAEESNANISKSTINQQCNNKCQAISAATNHNISSDPGSYDFCGSDSNFTSDADSCLTCLYDQQGLTVLGNILNTVVELCKKKPSKVINFLNDTEIYTATRLSFSSSSSPTTSPSNSSTASPSSTPESTSGSGISIGAIAGGILGGLVGIALLLGGILLLLRRKKKQNKNNNNTTELLGDKYSGNHHYGQVPQSAKDPHHHQTVEMHSPYLESGSQNASMEFPLRTVTPPGGRR